jgi:hypothetical protein
MSYQDNLIAKLEMQNEIGMVLEGKILSIDEELKRLQVRKMD